MDVVQEEQHAQGTDARVISFCSRGGLQPAGPVEDVATRGSKLLQQKLSSKVYLHSVINQSAGKPFSARPPGNCHMPTCV